MPPTCRHCSDTLPEDSPPGLTSCRVYCDWRARRAGDVLPEWEALVLRYYRFLCEWLVSNREGTELVGLVTGPPGGAIPTRGGCGGSAAPRLTSEAARQATSLPPPDGPTPARAANAARRASGAAETAHGGNSGTSSVPSRLLTSDSHRNRAGEWPRGRPGVER
jgi:hypothetical protein